MILDKKELLDSIKNKSINEYLFRNIELKRSWDSKYGKKISSLCNKSNLDKMWLIIGVEDDGNLSLQNEAWAKSTEEIVSQQINSNLDPFQACVSLSCEEIDQSWIVIIELINPGAVVKWEKNAYKGSGSTCELMTQEEIMELTIKLPGIVDFSKQLCERSNSQSLTEIFCNDLRNNNDDLKNISDNELLLTKMHMSGTQAERILLGNAEYRLIKINKEDVILENTTRKGLYSILTQPFYDELRDWFSNSNNIVQLSNKILRESLANAVAHSAYNEKDGDIIIELYPDKLIIHNLCYPEYKSFANKWFSRIHKSPNNFLMEILRSVKKVDELGRGKNIIFVESMKAGYKPPIVETSLIGRYNRWSLHLFCGFSDQKNIRLYKRIESHYNNNEKSLIALALVLWCDHKVSEILKYFGEAEYKTLNKVLTDLDGPIFYYDSQDQIVLNRWVRVLLDEGKESKKFTPPEEDRLYKFLLDIRTKYHDGYLTQKDIRKYGHLGETSSEKTLSSRLMSKWITEKKVVKISRGLYRFEKSVSDINAEEAKKQKALKLLEEFEKQISQ